MSPRQTFVAYIKNAHAPRPGPDVVVPAALTALIARVDDGVFSEDQLAELSTFISAVFVPSNEDALEEILSSMDDAEASSVSAYRAWLPDGAILPTLRVEATFELALRRAMSDDEITAWEEDTDAYLCGCVSFLWKIASTDPLWDGVIGEYEEAGMHLVPVPGDDSPPAPD